MYTLPIPYHRMTVYHITLSHTTASHTPLSHTLPSYHTLLTSLILTSPLFHPQVRALANTVAQQREATEGNGDGTRSSSGGPESDEVEEEANAYFQKIYTGEISVQDVIQMLKQFKSSSNVREQEVFRCMIHNLFDEYRFFHKYPEKELLVTGRLFGTLIQHQLVSSITLGIALRYVLEALRKDPEQSMNNAGVSTNQKMFQFGKVALEQFRSRLGEWPQYCSHLAQVHQIIHRVYI